MIIEVVYGVGENNILEKNLMSLFTSEMFRLPPLTYLIWRWTWPYSSRQYCRERAAGRGGEKSGLLCKCVVSIHSTQNGACLTLLGVPSIENKLYFMPFLLNLTQDLHSALELCMSKWQYCLKTNKYNTSKRTCWGTLSLCMGASPTCSTLKAKHKGKVSP